MRFLHPQIRHSDDGKGSPEGQRQLVGVEEVVHASVYKVGDEGQGHHEGQQPIVGVLGMIVGAQTGIKDYDKHHHDRQGTRDAGLGARTDIFAVRIATVTEIGGDDGLVLTLLIGGILKLVGAGTPSHHRPLLDHGEGRVPPVQSLHIGGVSGDVGHRLDMLHKRGGGVLAVATHLVEDVIGIKIEKTSDDETSDNQPGKFDMQFQDNPYTHGNDKTDPGSTTEGQV